MPHLYNYQQRVYDALMRGRSVILQAPTGGGKIHAPRSIHSWRISIVMPLTRQDSYPLRRQYRSPAAMPCRCVCWPVSSNVNVSPISPNSTPGAAPGYANATPKDSASQFQPFRRERHLATAHSSSPLTFCTIDQLLSSFIGSPYALGPRQANLNVGAVVGSYLILDEFHLYPLEMGRGARTTTLAMLRMLKGLCRFVLMMATFSSGLLDMLGVLLDAEVARGTAGGDELREIMGDRSRTVQLPSATAMSAQSILSAHRGACQRGAGASLVVCNTVAQAQAMYGQLHAALEADGTLEQTRLELLHSRFTQKDRQKKRELLEAWLGEASWVDGRYHEPSTIVVATQVVEVGLNISAGALHTELAPANSVIQRAGRCARFAGQRGEVWSTIRWRHRKTRQTRQTRQTRRATGRKRPTRAPLPSWRAG